MNNLYLCLELIVLYSIVVILYRYMGTMGMYMWTIIATISANIEVMISINAFGMAQTAGNIMFATTFVVTDILSEVNGKKSANRAVNIGIVTAIIFIVITRFWMLFIPNSQDWASESIHIIFGNTPRMMLASFITYAIAQRFDVWMYHKWWDVTSVLSGDSHKFLWIRNNGSTLLSQLINTVLFSITAFWGMYDSDTLIQICMSSYVIFIFTSLLDTPVVYAARWIKENGKVKED